MTGVGGARSRRRIALAAPFLAWGALGLALFPAAGRDDKYLTYWPAFTLARWGAIWNYDGERVEQSSSLLFVLLTAGVHRLTAWEPPIAGWWLGVAGGVAAIALAGRIAHVCRPGAAPAAMLLAAVSGPFAYWSFSGSEAPWVAATGIAFVLAAASPTSAPALVAAITAFLLVRPEAGFVAGAALAAWIGIRRTRRLPVRKAARALAAAAIVFALLCAFRLLYFGSVLPQSVVAKLGDPAPSTWLRGLAYLGAQPWLAPLGAAGLMGALRAFRGTEAAPQLLALVGLAYLAFVVTAGGDWMEGARFVAHVLPLWAALALYGLGGFRRPHAARAALVALVAISLVGTLQLARSESLSLPGWIAWRAPAAPDASFSWVERANRVQRRDAPVALAMREIVDRVRTAQPDKPRILVENAGFVAYHTMRRHFGEASIVDLHGLADRHATETSAARDVRRGRFGLMWRHADFLRLHGRIQSENGLPLPVVVFGNAPDPHPSWVARHGFRTVYWRRAKPDPGPSWLPGQPLRGGQLIAVRAALANRVAAAPLPGNQLEDGR